MRSPRRSLSSRGGYSGFAFDHLNSVRFKKGCNAGLVFLDYILFVFLKRLEIQRHPFGIDTEGLGMLEFSVQLGGVNEGLRWNTSHV